MYAEGVKLSFSVNKRPDRLHNVLNVLVGTALPSLKWP